MALFHLSVTQTKRSAGQSAIASAAYRAGERLYSEYYGEYSDYTRKGGVICSDILLPSHAPPEYADRQTLWNAVEKAERGKNAQLAYSFDIALQNEFSLEENIALARQFLLENFVSRGMVVDFAVHQPDREDGGIPNPHFHVLCPIRPIEQNGKWGLKQRRVYELDEDGNRIRDADGKFVFNAVPTTDWGSPETLEYWRQTWAELCNAKFAEKGLDVRIDHRSYERQGVDLLPTVHEGATVRAMEKKGIRTEKGEFNRWIRATNAVIRDIKKKITLLFDWIAEAKAELVVENLKIVQGSKGLFLGMPSQPDGKGGYRDMAYPVTKEFREQLNTAVLQAYEAKLEQMAERGSVGRASISDQLKAGKAAAEQAKAERPPKEKPSRGAER